MRATKATSVSNSRYPERGPKRGKSRNSKRSSSPPPYPPPPAGEGREGDWLGDESDETSKPVDVYADRDVVDSPGPPSERASLVCGRIRCEYASEADGIRDQDGMDQSSFMDLYRCKKA